MRRVSVSLNSKSIEYAIELLELEKKRIRDRMNVLIKDLARIGIRTATVQSGKYSGYISFESEINDTENGYVGALIARDKEKIISRWYRGGELVEREVSPLLLAEFGSGWYADVKDEWGSLQGEVGQGTFPGQIHAYDPGGWYWKDEQGRLHHSIGELPEYPVYNAWKAMLDAVDRMAKSVFAFA